MLIRLFIGLLLGCLLAGCSSVFKDNFKANYYFASNSKQLKEPSLYIAILNQSKSPQTITGISLNSPDGTTETGWTYSAVSANSPVDVDSGRLLILNTSEFNNGKNYPERCYLPVSVTINTKQDCCKRSEVLPAEMAGSLPSALPTDWIPNCNK